LSLEMVILFTISMLVRGQFLDVTSLFEFAAGLVAFFFVIVCVLIFVFIYDNLRRQKRAEAATT